MVKLSRISALFIIFVFSKTSGITAAITQPDVRKTIPMAEYNLREAMTQLWSDHGIWTRIYIIEALNNAPGKEAAADRLMKNQDDIGNAIAQFYGEDAGKKMTALLKNHIKIAVDIVDAAKANNQQKLKANDNLWHSNADDIALFLRNANPGNWKFKPLQTMLYDHLKLTTNEVLARLKKDWSGDVTNFDKVMEQLRGMGQELSNGIVKQFPAKFK
ncbi:MAG TPA: hypothetical protein VHO47_03440 [Candidatus Babeliales bacterium]|nr:hypothetical protein [Candidatus Babeliales bacterium]